MSLHLIGFRFNLWLFCSMQGDYESAVTVARQAALLRYADPYAWINLAEVHVHCREPHLALAALNTIQHVALPEVQHPNVVCSLAAFIHHKFIRHRFMILESTVLKFHTWSV